MTDLTQKQEWKAKANAEYQKVMGSIVALATASLMLPALFLRDFYAVPQGKPLLQQLSWPVFISWLFLLVSIASGIIFYYVSAKWLKQAYGGTVSVSERTLERLLDVCFWIAVCSFISGLMCLVWFLTTYTPRS